MNSPSSVSFSDIWSHSIFTITFIFVGIITTNILTWHWNSQWIMIISQSWFWIDWISSFCRNIDSMKDIHIQIRNYDQHHCCLSQSSVITFLESLHFISMKCTQFKIRTGILSWFIVNSNVISGYLSLWCQ
jgi:hypothetical protein